MKSVLQLIESMMNTQMICPPNMLFHEDFMHKHTQFQSWSHLVSMFEDDYGKSWFSQPYSSKEWNRYIECYTHFNSWHEMKEYAEAMYVDRNPVGSYYFQ